MIYLLCGVPGSGKTWVIERLPKGKFTHLDHDSHSHTKLVSMACDERLRGMRVVIDCPFGERALRCALEAQGLDVTPIFIVEHPDVVSARYFAREGREPMQNILTRAKTIKAKIEEWGAHAGTSEQILNYLTEVV